MHMIENIRQERSHNVNDKGLIQIMFSLTGWRFKPSTDDVVGLCDMSPPNWYAYLGLMETYEIKFMHQQNNRNYEL